MQSNDCSVSDDAMKKGHDGATDHGAKDDDERAKGRGRCIYCGHTYATYRRIENGKEHYLCFICLSQPSPKRHQSSSEMIGRPTLRNLDAQATGSITNVTPEIGPVATSMVLESSRDIGLVENSSNLTQNEIEMMQKQNAQLEASRCIGDDVNALTRNAGRQSCRDCGTVRHLSTFKLNEKWHTICHRCGTYCGVSDEATDEAERSSNASVRSPESRSTMTNHSPSLFKSSESESEIYPVHHWTFQDDQPCETCGGHAGISECSADSGVLFVFCSACKSYRGALPNSSAGQTETDMKLGESEEHAATYAPDSPNVEQAVSKQSSTNGLPWINKISHSINAHNPSRTVQRQLDSEQSSEEMDLSGDTIQPRENVDENQVALSTPHSLDVAQVIPNITDTDDGDVLDANMQRKIGFWQCEEDVDLSAQAGQPGDSASSYEFPRFPPSFALDMFRNAIKHSSTNEENTLSHIWLNEQQLELAQTFLHPITQFRDRFLNVDLSGRGLSRYPNDIAGALLQSIFQRQLVTPSNTKRHRPFHEVVPGIVRPVPIRYVMPEPINQQLMLPVTQAPNVMENHPIHSRAHGIVRHSPVRYMVPSPISLRPMPRQPRLLQDRVTMADSKCSSEMQGRASTLCPRLIVSSPAVNELKRKVDSCQKLVNLNNSMQTQRGPFSRPHHGISGQEVTNNSAQKKYQRIFDGSPRAYASQRHVAISNTNEEEQTNYPLKAAAGAGMISQNNETATQSQQCGSGLDFRIPPRRLQSENMREFQLQGVFDTASPYNLSNPPSIGSYLVHRQQLDSDLDSLTKSVYLHVSRRSFLSPHKTGDDLTHRRPNPDFIEISPCPECRDVSTGWCFISNKAVHVFCVTCSGYRYGSRLGQVKDNPQSIRAWIEIRQPSGFLLRRRNFDTKRFSENCDTTILEHGCPRPGHCPSCGLEAVTVCFVAADKSHTACYMCGNLDKSRPMLQSESCLMYERL